MDARSLPPRPDLEQYRKQAKDLLRAARAGDAEARRRLAPCPRLGAADGASTPVLADAQFVLAREHAFGSWPAFAAHIESLGFGDAPVARFEAAADAIVSGDLPGLGRLLVDDASLARARSTREHRATLLHYVAANGVEDYRQRTPANAAAIAGALLQAGADVDAPAETYGGGPAQTTLNLLVSSFHPAHAGLQATLVDVLVDAGARVDGVADDGSPLLTALAFHYLDAARTLVRRGARVDSVLAAAGVGDAGLVRACLMGETSLARPDGARTLPRWLHLRNHPFAERERALTWAAALGHRVVVDALLDAGVAIDCTDDQGFTPLHWAAFRGHLDVVTALISRGAPLEARNRYGGTVLGGTVWAAVHSGRAADDPRAGALPRVDYPAVVERLLAAGARVEEAEYPSGHAAVDALLDRAR